jgi:lipopolysaccharide transport system permease protein
MNTTSNYFLEFINIGGITRSLYNRRELIRTLTLRDFKARFRGSFGGVLWSVIQPLIMMVVYTLVFSGFLKVKFANSSSPFTFAVFLLCGLLPWTAFADGMSASTGLIRSNSNLVKRVVFPLEVLPVTLSFVALIQQVIGFGLLLPVAWLITGKVYWTVLFVPLIILLQILFYTGINWIWSSLSVYLPDLRQFTVILLSMLMFLTPIFYPVEILPTWAQKIMTFSPLANIMEMYRKAFLTGERFGLQEIGLTSALCLFVFLIGYFWFIHTKKGFPDVL